MAQLIKINAAPKKWHLKKAISKMPANFRILGDTLEASTQFDGDFHEYLRRLKEEAMSFKLAVRNGGPQSFIRGQIAGQVKIAIQLISLGGLWQMRSRQEASAIIELASSIAQNICGDAQTKIEANESIASVQQKIIDMFFVRLLIPESLLSNTLAKFGDISRYFIRDFFVAEEKLVHEARILVTCIDSEFQFDIEFSNLNRVLQSANKFLSHEQAVV